MRNFKYHPVEGVAKRRQMGMGFTVLVAIDDSILSLSLQKKEGGKIRIIGYNTLPCTTLSFPFSRFLVQFDPSTALECRWGL